MSRRVSRPAVRRIRLAAWRRPPLWRRRSTSLYRRRPAGGARRCVRCGPKRRSIAPRLPETAPGTRRRCPPGRGRRDRATSTRPLRRALTLAGVPRTSSAVIRAFMPATTMPPSRSSPIAPNSSDALPPSENPNTPNFAKPRWVARAANASARVGIR